MMNAAQVISYAKKHGLKPGPVLKKFRNGEELREYTIPGAVAQIRALPEFHA